MDSEIETSAVMTDEQNTILTEKFPRDIIFEDKWDTAAVAALIEDRVANGRRPSWIFLGKQEAALLKNHLIEAFGEESVQSLHRVYYMGMEVIEVNAPHFCRLAGHKFIGKLDSSKTDLRKWKEDDFSKWQFTL